MTTSGQHWEILLHRRVEKVLRRLPNNIVPRIDRAIQALSTDPRPTGCKKLAGHDNLYRVRVGDWRISYAVEDDRLIVLVLEVAPRGGANRF
jgi:mRNA interferase RelE/StbE